MQIQNLKKNTKYKYLDPRVVIDLVCGMELNSDKIKASKEYKGKTYYFCATHCKKHFTADPVKYVGE